MNKQYKCIQPDCEKSFKVVSNYTKHKQVFHACCNAK